MLFNSIVYWLFFVGIGVLHFALPHRYRWILLLAASYAFYMTWNATYAFLIGFSTLINFVAALAIHTAEAPRQRRGALVASIVLNLGLLFTFKYWNFANGAATDVFAAFGLAWPVPDLDVLLPVGISFYTFQAMGYVIDVYRGQTSPERHLGRFALYVVFFPQLVAGPIERARTLLPQFRRPTKPDWERITSGLQLAMWGLFKKVVIADRLALYVDRIYDRGISMDPASYVLATYAFAFQIYCDFSGYSDIAIGCGRALGYDLTKNFNLPYFATTIADFWQRWHITLSTWLRDYVFIPLGGAGHGRVRTMANLVATMTLVGLWHGASFNFVIFGAIHGALLALSSVTLQARDRIYARLGVPNALRDLIRIAITFHLFCLTLVFFRAETIAQALEIFASLFGPWRTPLVIATVFANAGIGLLVLAAVQLVQWRRGSARRVVAELPTPVRWGVWYALAFGIALFGVDGGSQFIYFQF